MHPEEHREKRETDARLTTRIPGRDDQREKRNIKEKRERMRQGMRQNQTETGRWTFQVSSNIQITMKEREQMSPVPTPNDVNWT